MSRFHVGLLLTFAAMAAAPPASHCQEVTPQMRDRYRQELATVQAEHAAVSKSLLELIEKHGTLVMSREKVVAEMASLEERAWQSTLEQEQASIRAELLRERLKKLAAEAEAAATKDEIAMLLEKKLALAHSKKSKIEALVKNGTVSSTELDEVEGLVADAQLALARHREAAKQSPEAQEIKAISAELAEIEFDVVVKEKTAAIYAQRSAKLKETLLRTADYMNLQRMEDGLLRRREHWEALLMQFDTFDFDPSEKPAAAEESKGPPK